MYGIQGFCVQGFCVSIIHQTLTWTAGSLTCVRDHSYACVYTSGVEHTDNTTFLTLAFCTFNGFVTISMHLQLQQNKCTTKSQLIIYRIFTYLKMVASSSIEEKESVQSGEGVPEFGCL